MRRRAYTARFIGRRRKGAMRKVFDLDVECQSKQGRTSFILALSA